MRHLREESLARDFDLVNLKLALLLVDLCPIRGVGSHPLRNISVVKA